MAESSSTNPLHWWAGRGGLLPFLLSGKACIAAGSEGKSCLLKGSGRSYIQRQLIYCLGLDISCFFGLGQIS